MKKHLKYIDGTSDKFWQIEVFGTDYKVTYGKNGTSGTTQTKSFATPEDCLSESEKILAEKIKKGYSETGEVSATASSGVKSAPNSKSSNTAAILEEYDSIIKFRHTDLLLPFLKEKSKGNIETLKKHIQKCKRYWMHDTDLSKDPEYAKNARGSSKRGTRGDSTQYDIIIYSAIALFDKSEILSWDEALSKLNNPMNDLIEILLWAKPNWIDTFILEKIKKTESATFSYNTLRKLEKHGLLQYNPELYALCLAAEYDFRFHINTKNYFPTVLQDKIIYERDIPQLFNYETNLHENSFSNNPWQIIFKHLLEEKKIFRNFFIENTIQIQTKEWNNNLKSFFRKWLEELNPTVDELLLYQESIFALLHSAYPPITSYGLELIKKIYYHPQYGTKSFLEWLEPLLMRSDCKTAIKTVLPILENISKSNPKFNQTIAEVLANIFVISDLTLQEKASKIIAKTGSEKDVISKEKLSSYTPLMQGNIKSVLANFLEADALTVTTTDLEVYTVEPKKVKVLIEEVQLPKNWNEILFQFGNFISSAETLDTEIMMNIFTTSRNLFPSDYSAQLKPYLKQLQKKYFGRSDKDCLNHFLIEKISNIDSNFGDLPNNYSRIYSDITIYSLLNKVQEKMKSGSELPLLSLPSHKPYWIAPKVLLERIIQYQENKEEIDPVDLAVAIARIPMENVQEAIPLLDHITGEYKQLLSFCLSISKKTEIDSASLFSKGAEENTKEFENLSLWAVAARTFYSNDTFPEFENTHLKDFPYVVAPFLPAFDIQEKWDEWPNYNDRTKMERSPSRYELHFDMPKFTSIPDYLLYSKLLYSYSFSDGATLDLHSLIPQNNDLLALILLRNCQNPNDSKPGLKGFLEIINRPEFNFTDLTTFLFAVCFFLDKKEIRLFASEILISLIEKQAVDVEKLAQKMAFLTVEKYGSFSRLTDGLIAVKDISPLHNSALLQLLDTFFENLDIKDKLPTNFKKLIENYLDFLTKTNQKPSDKATVFFKYWKDNTSLKSLIKQILK